MGLLGSKEKVKVKKRPAGLTAYIEHRGHYRGIPFDEYFGRLFAWAKEAKVRPGFSPFAVYLSDPKTTPESELVTRVSIPIGKAAVPTGDVRVAELPEMEVAVIGHSAPAEEYGKSYAELHKWIEENGYEPAGPPLELYTRKPKNVGGKMIIYSEIQFPVRKR